MTGSDWITFAKVVPGDRVKTAGTRSVWDRRTAERSAREFALVVDVFRYGRDVELHFEGGLVEMHSANAKTLVEGRRAS